ncbi:MAG TPA: glycosyltransferase family 4 protein, partial [Candidatus Bathyarchaeia archaeon]|nr:glycosyltransferase family 4 protein [Candidatus Bathyarchaeia archaeon]
FDIAQKHPDVKLIIVGSKRYLAQLQSLAAYLGIQQNVIFAGPITRQELPLYYAACDIVALPSTYEGFPVVALEALASGKPVVASRVGGIPEAIKTGSNGILFEAGDISALTEGLLTLLENRTLRDDMAHNARKIAEKEYNWKQITDKYITEFQRLL